jgi:hypothetical protein
MTIPTIGQSVQEAIIDDLPSDYDISMEIMCQLLANMAMSGDQPWSIDRTVAKVRENYEAYKNA